MFPTCYKIKLQEQFHQYRGTKKYFNAATLKKFMLAGYPDAQEDRLDLGVKVILDEFGSDRRLYWENLLNMYTISLKTDPLAVRQEFINRGYVIFQKLGALLDQMFSFQYNPYVLEIDKTENDKDVHKKCLKCLKYMSSGLMIIVVFRRRVSLLIPCFSDQFCLVYFNPNRRSWYDVALKNSLRRVIDLNVYEKKECGNPIGEIIRFIALLAQHGDQSLSPKLVNVTFTQACEKQPKQRTRKNNLMTTSRRDKKKKKTKSLNNTERKKKQLEFKSAISKNESPFMAMKIQKPITTSGEMKNETKEEAEDLEKGKNDLNFITNNIQNKHDTTNEKLAIANKSTPQITTDTTTNKTTPTTIDLEIKNSNVNNNNDSKIKEKNNSNININNPSITTTANTTTKPMKIKKPITKANQTVPEQTTLHPSLGAPKNLNLRETKELLEQSKRLKIKAPVRLKGTGSPSHRKERSRRKKGDKKKKRKIIKRKSVDLPDIIENKKIDPRDMQIRLQMKNRGKSGSLRDNFSRSRSRPIYDQVDEDGFETIVSPREKALALRKKKLPKTKSAPAFAKKNLANTSRQAPPIRKTSTTKVYQKAKKHRRKSSRKKSNTSATSSSTATVTTGTINSTTTTTTGATSSAGVPPVSSGPYGGCFLPKDNPAPPELPEMDDPLLHIQTVKTPEKKVVVKNKKSKKKKVKKLPHSETDPYNGEWEMQIMQQRKNERSIKTNRSVDPAREPGMMGGCIRRKELSLSSMGPIPEQSYFNYKKKIYIPAKPADATDEIPISCGQGYVAVDSLEQLPVIPYSSSNRPRFDTMPIIPSHSTNHEFFQKTPQSFHPRSESGHSEPIRGQKNGPIMIVYE